MRKAQTWSTDTIVAVAIFAFVIIFVFYFVGTQQKSQNIEDMQSESTKIPAIVSSPQKENTSFIENNKVSKEKLASFTNMSYDEIKQKLGLRYDFCIYFEDEEGKIINLTYGRPGVGSPNTSVAGAVCGLSSEQIATCRAATGDCSDLGGGVTKEDCCAYLGLCC
jgi:hypothetical protein